MFKISAQLLRFRAVAQNRLLGVAKIRRHWSGGGRGSQCCSWVFPKLFTEKSSLPLGQAVVGAQLRGPLPPAVTTRPSWPDNVAILLPRKHKSNDWKEWFGPGWVTWQHLLSDGTGRKVGAHGSCPHPHLLPVPAVPSRGPAHAVHNLLHYKDVNCYKWTWFASVIYKASEHPSHVSEIIPKHSAQFHSPWGRCAAFASTSQFTDMKGQAHTSAGKQHRDKWHEQPISAHTISSSA